MLIKNANFSNKVTSGFDKEILRLLPTENYKRLVFTKWVPSEMYSIPRDSSLGRKLRYAADRFRESIKDGFTFPANSPFGRAFDFLKALDSDGVDVTLEDIELVF